VNLTATLTQTVTFSSLTASQYAQNSAYDKGYASLLGIYSGVAQTTNAITYGCTLSRTYTSASNDGVTVNYTVTMPILYASAANTAAGSSNASTALQSAIQGVITASYSSQQNIPAPIVATTSTPVLTVSTDASGVSSGNTPISQTVSYSLHANITLDANTKLVYQKGYGLYLGLYSSSSGWTTGSSVTSYATSTASGTDVTFISVVPSGSYSAALSAASSNDAAALQTAIQSVISTEYSFYASIFSTPATASSFASTTVISPSNQATGSISLTGLSSLQVDSTVQSGLKTAIALSAGSNCGSLGTTICTSAGVTLTSVGRRDVTIGYSVDAYSADAASSIASSIASAISDGSFLSNLQNQGGALASVSGVSAGSSNDRYSGFGYGQIAGIAGGISFGVLMVAFVAYGLTGNKAAPQKADAPSSAVQASANTEHAKDNVPQL